MAINEVSKKSNTMTNKRKSIKLPTPFAASKSKNSQIYIHNVLTQFRQEQVNSFFNPRHFRQVIRDSAPANRVFKIWKEDTSDIIKNVMKHDWDLFLLTRVIPNENELRKIRNEIINNFYWLKEIFHHL